MINKIFDPLYWKYQSLIESYIETIKKSQFIVNNKELLITSLAHIARKIYDMGYQDAMRHYEPEMPIDQEKLIPRKKKVN